MYRVDRVRWRGIYILVIWGQLPTEPPQTIWKPSECIPCLDGRVTTDQDIIGNFFHVKTCSSSDESFCPIWQQRLKAAVTRWVWVKTEDHLAVYMWRDKVIPTTNNSSWYGCGVVTLVSITYSLIQLVADIIKIWYTCQARSLSGDIDSSVIIRTLIPTSNLLTHPPIHPCTDQPLTNHLPSFPPAHPSVLNPTPPSQPHTPNSHLTMCSNLPSPPPPQPTHPQIASPTHLMSNTQGCHAGYWTGYWETIPHWNSALPKVTHCKIPRAGTPTPHLLFRLAPTTRCCSKPSLMRGHGSTSFNSPALCNGRELSQYLLILYCRLQSYFCMGRGERVGQVEEAVGESGGRRGGRVFFSRTREYSHRPVKIYTFWPDE